MSKKCIAIIYEGNRTEKMLIQNIEQHFFKGAGLVPISFPAGQNLYMLWNRLKTDEFQTDVLEVLREYNKIAKDILCGYTRADFSEIYMFFDYDGHVNNLTNGMDIGVVLEQMLETFDDETDLGKLYISYPMVEALRDNLPPDLEKCYRRCWVEHSKIGSYKNMVSDIKEYQNFKKISLTDWRHLCQNSLKKLNCLFHSNYSIPARNEFLNDMTQLRLYKKQKSQYIDSEKVAIFSSIPLFLLEYFKLDFWEKMIQN